MKAPSRKPGFTLVEIMLAVSVVVLMTAIAVPSFSAFNASNSWNDSTQRLLACVQDAQRLAAAPEAISGAGGTVRFIGFTLAYSAASNTLACADNYYSDTNGVPFTVSGSNGLNANPSPSGSLGQQVTVNGVYGMTVSAPVVSPDSFTVYFGVSQGGLPVAYSYAKSGLPVGGGTFGGAMSFTLTQATGSKAVFSLPGGVGAVITVVNS